jgi:nucleotide-binding universal stress UspA family protein
LIGTYYQSGTGRVKLTPWKAWKTALPEIRVSIPKAGGSILEGGPEMRGLVIRIRKILCPVDFSAPSERAAAYAVALAAKSGAAIRILHVVSPLISGDPEFPLNGGSVRKTLESEAKSGLRSLLEKVGVDGVPLEGRTVAGDIFARLLEGIESYKPDLVVMGTHGRRGFKRWILGSTTERMLRHSPVPVLTIPGGGASQARPKPIRNVFVATDLSEDTAEAMTYALSIAEDHAARVTLLHVLDHPRAITSRQYRDALAAEAKNRCAKLMPKRAAGAGQADVRIEAGTPFHVVLEVSRKEKADLLVMNTHGQGMFNRVLLGSTTDRVVRGATCPVLLIPPKRKTARDNRKLV